MPVTVMIDVSVVCYMRITTHRLIGALFCTRLAGRTAEPITGHTVRIGRYGPFGPKHPSYEDDDDEDEFAVEPVPRSRQAGA